MISFPRFSILFTNGNGTFPEAAGLSGCYSWGGAQGVQTMLPALFTHGVRRRGLSVEMLVRLVSENPARLMGLYPRKGVIRIGSDADLTILDPSARWTLAPEMLLHKNKHSPYMGMEFEGRVTATLVRGAVVFDGRGITADPGSGRLLLKKKDASQEVF